MVSGLGRLGSRVQVKLQPLPADFVVDPCSSKYDGTGRSTLSAFLALLYRGRGQTNTTGRRIAPGPEICPKGPMYIAVWYIFGPQVSYMGTLLGPKCIQYHYILQP